MVSASYSLSAAIVCGGYGETLLETGMLGKPALRSQRGHAWVLVMVTADTRWTSPWGSWAMGAGMQQPCQCSRRGCWWWWVAGRLVLGSWTPCIGASGSKPWAGQSLDYGWHTWASGSQALGSAHIGYVLGAASQMFWTSFSPGYRMLTGLKCWEQDFAGVQLVLWCYNPLSGCQQGPRECGDAGSTGHLSTT